MPKCIEGLRDAEEVYHSAHKRCMRDCKEFKDEYKDPLKQMFVEYLQLENRFAQEKVSTLETTLGELGASGTGQEQFHDF